MTTTTGHIRPAELSSGSRILPALQSWVTRALERIEFRAYRRLRTTRESEIARFLAANGGHLTDDLEREISRRYGNIVGQ